MAEKKSAPMNVAHCEFQIKTKSGNVFFSMAGCGSREEHKVAPNYSKQYDFDATSAEFFKPKPLSFLTIKVDQYQFLIARQLIQPPRI